MKQYSTDMKLHVIQKLVILLIVASLSQATVLAQDLPFNPKEVKPEIKRLQKTNTDSALIFIEHYLQISRESNWLLGEANLIFEKGRTYQMAGKFQMAINSCQAVIQFIADQKSNVSEDDLRKFLILNARANLFIGRAFSEMGQYDSATVYAKIALRKNAEMGLENSVAMSSEVLLGIEMLKGQSSKALVLSQEIIDTYKQTGFDGMLPGAYLNHGQLLSTLGDVKGTLEYYLLASEKAEELGDISRLSYSFTLIGGFYERLGEYKKALSYNLRSIELSQQIDDKSGITFSYINTGGVYKNLGSLDSAQYFFEKGLEISEEAESKADQAFIFHELAELEILRKDPQKALQLSEKGLVILQEVTIPLEEALLLSSKAKSLRLLNRNQEALILAYEMEKLVATIDNLTYQKTIYWTLQEVYSANNLDQKAHQFLMKHTQVADSLNNEEKSRAVARVEFNHELEEETARLEAEKERELERQEWKLYSSLGATCLILIIAVVIYRSYKTKKADNKQLAHQSELLSMRNEELLVLREKEQELIQKEREYMEESMSSKERQLATITMLSHEKNAILNQLQSQLTKIKETVSPEGIADIKKANKLIQNNLNMQNSWENFVYQFENVHPNFFTNIKAQFPNLTPNELKIAAYIKIGFDNKQISQAVGMSYEAVRKGIYRLKKRLNLGVDDNLRDFIGKV